MAEIGALLNTPDRVAADWGDLAWAALRLANKATATVSDLSLNDMGSLSRSDERWIARRGKRQHRRILPFQGRDLLPG
jgi:hypothetical protein